jgi:hypothetical protein
MWISVVELRPEFLHLVSTLKFNIMPLPNNGFEGRHRSGNFAKESATLVPDLRPRVMGIFDVQELLETLLWS